MFYKNWARISEIPCAFLRIGFSLLDTGTRFGRYIAERLPELFPETPPADRGPVPLSAIRRKAQEKIELTDHCLSSGAVAIIARDCFDVPVFDFATSDIGAASTSKLLPKDIGWIASAGEGQVLDCSRGRIIMMANMPDKGIIMIAPAECIKIDCVW